MDCRGKSTARKEAAPMNLGMETEYVEHKRSTSEMREGMESVTSILNKHILEFYFH